MSNQNFSLFFDCILDMVQLNPHRILLQNDNIIQSLGQLLQKKVQLSPNLF